MTKHTPEMPTVIWITYGTISNYHGYSNLYPNGATKYTRSDITDTLLEALKEAQAIVVEDIKDCGPCDHKVNVCVCHLIRLADKIDAILKSAEESK